MPQRAAAIGLVLLMHLAWFGLLLAAWRQHDRGLQELAARPSSLLVTLLQPPASVRARAARAGNSGPAGRIIQATSISPQSAEPLAGPSAKLAIRDSSFAASTQASAPESETSSAASAPLNLRLPARLPYTSGSEQAAVRDQALHDPRANSVRLNLSERFAIAMGAVACFYEERLPDGSIARAPGRLEAQASSGTTRDSFGQPMQVTNPVPVCVKAP